MTCLHLILSVHKYNNFFVTACNIHTMWKQQISTDFHNSNLSSIEHPTHGWHKMCDITSKLSLRLQGNHHDIMLSFCPFHTIQKKEKSILLTPTVLELYPSITSFPMDKLSVLI
jgi:hypothetical protein